MGAVAGAQPGEDPLRVGADRLGAQPEPPRHARGGLPVRIELEDLALAAGQRRAAAGRSLAAGSTKRSDSAAASTASLSASTGELLTT